MDRYAAGSPAGGKTIRFLRIKAEGIGMNSFENAVNATYLSGAVSSGTEYL